MYQKENLTYSSLEPYISDRTLSIHYNNHYLKYLKNLNDLLLKENYNFKYTKEELFNHIDEFNISSRDKILFNLGGVVNHELYFYNISDLKNNIPVGSIKKEIDEYYGNYETFKKEFKKMALELVGSGYTYLVINKNKELQIINMSNQESPYMYGMIPIIALDLWEHAYYLDYQNNKEKYIDTFFEIIDFNKINNLYEKEKNKI
ncbi:MAG: superoxide dismutase [Lactobacillales bacterium]|nr:superoxide dismutase [Lactobacillales bacterium]